MDQNCPNELGFQLAEVAHEVAHELKIPVQEELSLPCSVLSSRALASRAGSQTTLLARHLFLYGTVFIVHQNMPRALVRAQYEALDASRLLSKKLGKYSATIQSCNIQL